jgi:hypothetical protein
MQAFESPPIIECIHLKTEAKMMDQIFDWCVWVLVYWADIFGITYKEINVWVFVIIWPILTIIMTLIIIRQWQKIRQLTQTH